MREGAAVDLKRAALQRDSTVQADTRWEVEVAGFLEEKGRVTYVFGCLGAVEGEPGGTRSRAVSAARAEAQ